MSPAGRPSSDPAQTEAARALSRRDFLALAVAAGGSLLPAVPAHGQPPIDAFPFARLVADFRAAQRGRPTPVTPTGVTRASYLPVIDGIARFFAPLQDPRGAIIDPYEKSEKQYATPAFALAAAVLAASGHDRGLVGAGARAMETACADLASGQAADGHADFYTVLLLHADRVLSPLVARADALRWQASLRAVVPEKVYRFQPTAEPVNNWNVVAAAGEWLRTRDGYGRSTEWIEASLARHVPKFTASGMYRDPNDPMAYDHFARLWALDLAAEGYRGDRATLLETLLERAAWMSLFMQSPIGELPCGGRSAHHQWNEAQQAVTFETFAARSARQGDAIAAGAFKRAAALALQSISRWVRPSGELWIVKNRLDPALRHGYEVYSFHSQYNLLTAAMLALAWLRADERVEAAAAPADAGGYAFALQPAFHKAFAAAGGYYVEIDTGADPFYNPTGILRVHHRDVHAELLSDGVTTGCAYKVPRRPTRSLALGPAWQAADGQWHSLASHAAADLDAPSISTLDASPASVTLVVEYRGRLRGGATAVRERIRLSSAGVEVEHRVEGQVGAVREIVPYLASDGRSESRVSVTPGHAEVSADGGRLTVSPLRPGSDADGVPVLRREADRQPGRNGFVETLAVDAPGPRVGVRLTSSAS